MEVRRGLTEQISLGAGATAEARTVELVAGLVSHRVVMTEAYWADVPPPMPRQKKLRWLLSLLPALALLVIPDAQDKAMTDGMAARLLLRLMIAAGLLLAAWGASQWMYTELDPIVTGSAVLIALVLLGLVVRRNGFVDQVRMAAGLGDQPGDAEQRISAVLKWAELNCREVVVVAHSQGGFLTHRVLARQFRQMRVTFIAVGSGLRPLTVLRAMRHKKIRTAAWVWAAYVVVYCVVAAVALATESTAVITFPVQVIVVAVAGLTFLPEDWPELLQAIRSPDLSEVASLFILPVAFLAAAVVGLMLRPVFRASWKIAESELKIRNLPRARWTEVSSVHDGVGRMGWPPLPDSTRTVALPVTGNGIRDHISYFSKRGYLAWLVSHEVLTAMRLPGIAHVYEAARAAQKGANRRRRAATVLVLTVFALGFVQSVVLGANQVEALARALPGALGVLAICSIALWLIQPRSTRRGVEALARGEPVTDEQQTTDEVRECAGFLLATVATVSMVSSSLMLLANESLLAGLVAASNVLGLTAGAVLVGVLAGYRPRWRYIAAFIVISLILGLGGLASFTSQQPTQIAPGAFPFVGGWVCVCLAVRWVRAGRVPRLVRMVGTAARIGDRS